MTIRRTFLIAAGALVTAPALPAFAGGHGCLGMFTGASNHVMSGRAEIAKEGGKTSYTFWMISFSMMHWTSKSRWEKTAMTGRR